MFLPSYEIEKGVKNMSVSSEYTKTYTSFSGCDIVPMFGDTVIGELQAITYSVQRETSR